MTRSRSLVDAVAARGELDRTVIVFLTDNGYEFGLHRLEGKRYPYEPSIGFRSRSGRRGRSLGPTRPSSANVDLASTISELAQVRPELLQDGISLVPALEGRPIAERPGVWLDWGGDENVPALVRRPDGGVHLRSERRRNRGALPQRR
jgi:arylsulfatase A-like enzyme